MDLSKELFDSYFNRQIDIECLINRVGVLEKDFLEYLLSKLYKVLESKDAIDVENYIYTLYLWNERNDIINFYKINELTYVLNNLLVANWHYKHEDIVWLLQKIGAVESLKYLYEAIELHLQYLEWDNNYAFEVKCVRAIYHIGKNKSVPYLKKLCEHSNDIISELAKRQLKKIV